MKSYLPMIYTLLLPLAAVAQAAAAVAAMAGASSVLTAALALAGLAATALAWWVRLPQELSMPDLAFNVPEREEKPAPVVIATVKPPPRAVEPSELGSSVTLLDATRDATTGQFELLHDEFEQLRGILGDATNSLSSSLTGVDNTSTDQRQQLRVLIDQLLATTSGGAQEEQSHGVHRFARQSDAIVTRLVSNLGDLSACGDRAGDAFGGLLQRVEDILHHTREVDAINEQINLLATHTAIDSVRASEEGRRLARIAMDVRNLAERTRRFSTELRMVIEDARAHASDLGTEVQRMRGLDLAIAEEARDEVRRMGEVMRDLNSRASSQFELVSELSQQIRIHVFSGVMSLQFEDLMRQLMEHVEARISAVETTNGELISLQRDTLLHTPAGAEHIARLQEINRASEHRFAALSHKSVSQTAMDEGEAEMF